MLSGSRSATKTAMRTANRELLGFFPTEPVPWQCVLRLGGDVLCGADWCPQDCDAVWLPRLSSQIFDVLRDDASFVFFETNEHANSAMRQKLKMKIQRPASDPPSLVVQPTISWRT